MQTHSKVYGARPLSLSHSLFLSLICHLQRESCIGNEFLEESIPKFTIKAWLPCQAIRSHPVENPWPFLVLYAKGSQSQRYHWKSRVDGHFSAGTLFYSLHISLEFNQHSKNLSYFAICTNCNIKCNNHVCKMGSWSTWLTCVILTHLCAGWWCFAFSQVWKMIEKGCQLAKHM